MTSSELREQRERLAALEPWRIRVGGRPASKMAASESGQGRAAAPLERPQVMLKGVCDET